MASPARILTALALFSGPLTSMAEEGRRELGQAEWPSMSRARVAAPVPEQAPMASDLVARPPPLATSVAPAPARVPAAEPKPATRPAARKKGAARDAPPPAPAAPAPAVLERVAVAAPEPPPAAAPAPPPPVRWQAYPQQYPLPQFTPAAPAAAAGPPAAPALAVATAGAERAGPTPAAHEGGAGPDSATAPSAYEADLAASAEPNETRVTVAADHTGLMVEARQKLESDRIRQSWAARGGQIGAYELGVGMMTMGLSQAGMTMVGLGVSGSVRAALLSLRPPSYERRDRSWFATKIGVGLDMGGMGITITTPVTCAPYVGCMGGTSSATMSSITLVSTLGFMKAFGSFDSPTEWSGWAIGAEWAPSYQSTSMSVEGAAAQTSSNSNWTGFALNLERGSMAAMAGKMGKQAHVKMRFFMLPPISATTPFFMTLSLGWVWY